MGYRDGDARGIAGWLAFLVTLLLSAVSTLVITGITVVQLRTTAHPLISNAALNRYLGASAAVGLAATAGWLWLAWNVNARHRPSTPRLVNRWLWQVAVGPPIAIAALGGALLGIDAAALGRAMGADVARPAIYTLIWTLYFARSRRVAATYGTGASDEELAGVFG